MACIACGLGVNVDGKGRVDVDTVGGLTCAGAGGGTSNTSGSGLAIKQDTGHVGNSVEVTADGLYVPRSWNFELYQDDTYGQNVADPNYPTGSSWVSPTASITFDNTTGITKAYVWTVDVFYGTTDADPGHWMELNTQLNGAGWGAPSAMSFTANNIRSPLASGTHFAIVPPGQSHKAEGRFRLYRGYLYEYRIVVTGWGGYAYKDN